MPHSCALLGGFAIGARIALLWQHNANAKCQRVHACTRSMPIVAIAIELRTVSQHDAMHFDGDLKHYKSILALQHNTQTKSCTAEHVLITAVNILIIWTSVFTDAVWNMAGRYIFVMWFLMAALRSRCGYFIYGRPME